MNSPQTQVSGRKNLSLPASYDSTYPINKLIKSAERITEENINDDKTNQTKYILIGNFDTFPTGNDKTAIAFATNNSPGALLEILQIFLENDINLTYISSQPSKDDMEEYIFIVNFNGHIKDTKIMKVLNEIKSKTIFYRFLGSYEKNIS